MLEYSARLSGKSNTLIDYRIVLEPTLSNYNIRQYSAGSPSLVDIAWRGLQLILHVIDGVEINFPGSALEVSRT